MKRKKSEIQKDLAVYLPIHKATSDYMVKLQLEKALYPNDARYIERIRLTEEVYTRIQRIKDILEDELKNVDE